MSYIAIVYQVLVASPNDVTEERDAISQAIHSWNASNSRDFETVLLPIRWETHSIPGMEGRPQGMIKKQLVDPSDILVGVFWTRIGTDTGVSESGTIEEIEDFKRASKKVLLYFSQKDIPYNADHDQCKAVNKFKERIINEKWGLIDSFSTTSELQEKLNKHLTAVMREIKSESISSTINVAIKVSKETQFATIKKRLLALQDTYSVEWTSEKHSKPLDIKEGKQILRRFGKELLKFRPELKDLVTDGYINTLDRLQTQIKTTQKHKVYADGDKSYREFWQEGDEIFRQVGFIINNMQL
jgi:hypothetical protein